MKQPAKAAMPFAAGMDEPGALQVIGVTGATVSETEVETAVTTLPVESWTATTGCPVHAVPATPPFGWVVNTTFDAAVVMLNALPTALVSPALLARSV